MSSPYLGEIRIFPFNFAPRTWAMCQGQILPISQNNALFALLGTTYGGNGQSNFALPNLQGQVPLGQGQGAGLSQYPLGDTGGTTTVQINQSTLASHTHPLTATNSNASAASPAQAYYAKGNWTNSGTTDLLYAYDNVAPDTSLRNDAVGSTGGGQSHNNLMPYLTLNFCIALQGLFPPRP